MSQLPKGWSNQRLDEFADLNVRPKKGELDDSLEVSFIPMKAVEALTNKISTSETKTLEEVKKGYTPMREGDVIFAKVTPCMENGKIAVAKNLVNGVGFGSSEFHTFRVSADNSADFLQRYLVQRSFRQVAAQNMTGAVGLRRVPKAYLAEQIIPTPTPSEQKRIVAKLDTCQGNIDRSSEALDALPQLLENYRASLLAKAFRGDLTKQWRADQKAQGIEHESAQDLLTRLRQERRQQWEQTELKKYEAKGKTPPKNWEQKYKEPVNSPQDEGTPSSWVTAKIESLSVRVTVGHVGSMKNRYTQSGVSFLRGQNVRPYRYAPKGLAYIDTIFHNELSKSQLTGGDVLVTRSGDVGVSCVVPYNLKEANCSDLVIIQKPFEQMGNFISLYINNITLSQIRINAVGVALRHFNTKSVAELNIPLPPLREQIEIVRLLEAAFTRIDALKELHTKLSKQHSNLTQSLLAKAFCGKLVPQEKA